MSHTYQNISTQLHVLIPKMVWKEFTVKYRRLLHEPRVNFALNRCAFPCSIRVTFLLGKHESGQPRVLGCLSLSSSPEYKSVGELHKSITWAGRCCSGRLDLTRDSLTSTLCSCQTFNYIQGTRILLIRRFHRFSYSSTFCPHNILGDIKQKGHMGHILKTFTRWTVNYMTEWVLFG